MSVLPIVNPANNADGIPLIPAINAIYPFALDEGSVASTNCFLVKKTTVLGANQTVPVPVKITAINIELLTGNESSVVDYGDDSQAGLKFRTKIELLPINHLQEHTEYSVILSKDLSKTTVFTPKPVNTNVGTKAPLAKGPFTGLTADVYTVEIVIGGNENNAKYKVIRGSNNLSIENFVAKKRFIEIEKGLFLKFDTGTYVAGDRFIINVKPLVKVNEIYSWDFKTGDGSYVTPSDSNSGVVVGLPIEHDSQSSSIPPTVAPFGLTSISPSFNSVMNKPGRKASVTTQKITFSSKYRVNTFNGKRLKFILDELNPPSITVGSSIDITFQALTTKAEIVELINSTVDFKAETTAETEVLVENLVGALLLPGEIGGQVTLTFNKDIKSSSFSKEKLNILAESTAATYYGSIDFDYKIEANKLIINFL
jgi:hypothetical protein